MERLFWHCGLELWGIRRRCMWDSDLPAPQHTSWYCACEKRAGNLPELSMLHLSQTDYFQQWKHTWSRPCLALCYTWEVRTLDKKPTWFCWRRLKFMCENICFQCNVPLNFSFSPGDQTINGLHSPALFSKACVNESVEELIPPLHSLLVSRPPTCALCVKTARVSI